MSISHSRVWINWGELYLLNISENNTDGKCSGLWIRFFLMAILLIVTLGCSPQQEAPALTKQSEVARAVTVAEVVLKPMVERLVVSGLLVSWEEVAVYSELTGYRVANVLFEEGAVIEKGQVLAELIPELLQVQILQATASLEEARAQAAQATSEAARVSNFDGKGILSDQDMDVRRLKARAATANVKVAKARLAELQILEKRLLVRSPVAGVILERNVREGDIANSNTQMFSIARDGIIEVAAEVPEHALAGISLGQIATIVLPSGTELEGVTRLISPRIDAKTKLGKVRIRLPRHSELRSGGYARVSFESQPVPIPAVPEKAIQFEAGGPSVVVIDGENRARRLALQTTTRANGFVAFKNGPPVGSKVALGGGAFLLEGDLVKPVYDGFNENPPAQQESQ